MEPDWLYFERQAQSNGFQYIAGVDEAGRGPLAGPVVAAAVVFLKERAIEGINDSKKLSELERRAIYSMAQNDPFICHGIGVVDVQEIDRINILQATFLAMQKAVEALSLAPDFILVDGNQKPSFSVPCLPIVKGDQLSQSIALASIFAKVTRDQMMIELDQIYPEYGFKQHKGYPTRLHKEKIKEKGLSPCHRLSFSSN